MNSIEFAERFLKFESDNNLFSENTLNNNDAYLWEIIRSDIFGELLILLSIYKKEKPIIKQRKSFLFYIIQVFSYLKHEVSFWMKKKTFRTSMFFIVSRFVDKNGRKIDHYLKDFIPFFQNDNFTIELYNEGTEKNHFIEQKYYHELKRYMWITEKFEKLFPYLLSNKEIQVFSTKIETLINKEFNTSYCWSKLILKKISIHKLDCLYAKYLLKKINPKIVFLHAYPRFYRSTIKVCKDLGIISVEVQHGSITPGSISVRFDQNISFRNLKLVPHYIITLSEYWKKMIDPRLPSISVGNSFFYTDTIKNKLNNIFLVISGNFIYNKLMELTIELAKALPDNKFIYKLHPSENYRLEQAKTQTKESPNIEIIFNERDINQLIKEAKYLLLIQSTCAYQALQNGCDLLILKSQYYQESSDIFDLENVHLVSGLREIIRVLTEKNQLSIAESEQLKFFEKFSEEKFINFLHSIKIR